MNQNEWNESYRRAQGENDASHAQRTQYTTENGGSGVRYHADRSRWEGGYSKEWSEQTEGSSRCRRYNGRITAVLILLVCITLGFGLGMLGAQLLARPNQPDGTVDGEYIGEPSDTRFPEFGESLSADVNQPTVPYGERNPKPSMDKSESLGALTYSGSAGEYAYPTLAQAIESVAVTVVEISTETVVNGGWLGNYVSSGAGSGVIISEDGYIVTNHHVIAGADAVSVRMTDGTVYTAEVIGKDNASDIAVLWIDTMGEPLQAAQLGCSEDLIVGEQVFAIGNPLGALGGTVTDGIISATARSITVNGEAMTLLQTNAAVNPGNSGGGLFNMAGQLIGVVNAKSSEDDAEGLGFAIPVDTAYEVINQLIQYGYVRGKIDHGLSLYDITGAHIMTAWRYFQSTRAGVYIVESAYSDQLRYGDLILGVNGVAVESSAQFQAALSGCMVGDTVTLTVLRAEKQYEIELTLREYVPSDLNVQFAQNKQP
jgi:serine protease Do